MRRRLPPRHGSPSSLGRRRSACHVAPVGLGRLCRTDRFRSPPVPSRPRARSASLPIEPAQLPLRSNRRFHDPRPRTLAAWSSSVAHPSLIFCMRGAARDFSFAGFYIQQGSKVAYRPCYTGRQPDLF